MKNNLSLIGIYKLLIGNWQVNTKSELTLKIEYLSVFWYVILFKLIYINFVQYNPQLRNMSKIF